MSLIASYEFPEDRYYDAEHHTWALPEADARRVTIGIDILGLESLGDLAYVALNPLGSRVRRGESLGTLEAAKMTGDFVSPIGGIVVARNERVLNDPGAVNQDAYGGGWFVAIEPDDWAADARELISGGHIAGWVRAEVERYRTQGWIS